MSLRQHPKKNMDLYTNFSVCVDLPNDASLQCALELHGQARQGKPLPAGFPAELEEVVCEWDFDAEPSGFEKGLWLHSQNGGVDAACHFIQHLLTTFNPQGRVAFEWSKCCPDPRVPWSGGGAAIVTATEIKWFDTESWLLEQGKTTDVTNRPITDCHRILVSHT